MSSPEEPAPPLSFISVPSSFCSSSTSEGYALLHEKFNEHQHARRIPMRHRAWWLLLSMTAAGMLFARLVWYLAPRTDEQPHAEPLEAHLAWDIGGSSTSPFELQDDIRIVALVSYVARSRTSILDCYLQSNLAINDGLLDQVIFVPETGQERDMDWLYALIQSTPGYFMLGKPEHGNGDDFSRVPIADDPSTETSEQGVSVRQFARSWNLALSASQSRFSPLETQNDNDPVLDSTLSSDSDVSTVYIFIHSETVFLAHDTISHLLQTHFAHPSYAFVHANVVNQPVLSWVHHHLGVVRPYRPETEPPIRFHRNKTAEKIKAEEKRPWRASELPLWRDSRRAKDNILQNPHYPDQPPAELPKDFSHTEGPNLFNVPIEFHSPFRGHRWLPHHPHEHHPLSQSQPGESSEAQAENEDAEAESISTPITQAMMSLQRPGKWPWTLSALHLYSFLEHLECTPPHSYISALLSNMTEVEREGKYEPNCTTTGGLERYNMGLWEYQAERYGMSLFAIDSRMVSKIGPLPTGVSEAEILERTGKGAAIDGGSMAVRFVGSTAEDGVSEKRGLESTDLLERFESVSREVGGCDALGVLR